ncbi:MAG: FAD-binding oxidoreductase, partial [Acetobacteraceae bacterium]
MSDTSLSSSVLDRLHASVSGRNVFTDPADIAPYLEDWRKLYQGRAQAVVRPGSTAEVAAVIRLCAEAGVPVVPQGGNTS